MLREDERGLEQMRREEGMEKRRSKYANELNLTNDRVEGPDEMLFFFANPSKFYRYRKINKYTYIIYKLKTNKNKKRPFQSAKYNKTSNLIESQIS